MRWVRQAEQDGVKPHSDLETWVILSALSDALKEGRRAERATRILCPSFSGSEDWYLDLREPGGPRFSIARAAIPPTVWGGLYNEWCVGC